MNSPARISTMRNTIFSQTNSYTNGVNLKAQSSEHVTEKEVALHAIASPAASIHHNLLVKSLRLKCNIAMRRVMQRHVIIGNSRDHVLMQHSEKGMVKNRLISHVELLRDLNVLEKVGNLGLRVYG
jgi:hypothetical protein